MVFSMLLGQVGEHMRPQPVFWTLVIQWFLPFTIVVAVLLAFCRAAKYFGSAAREQKLLRMETGKLAEEVHLLRQELKGNKDSDTSAQ